MTSVEVLAAQNYSSGSEILSDSAEIDSLLYPYLSKLALPTDNYESRIRESRKSGESEPGDELDQGLISLVTDEDFDKVTFRSLGDKGPVLTAIAHISDALHENPQFYQVETISWENLTLYLLNEYDKSDETENLEENKNPLLLSAFISSLLSGDREVRISFVKNIYDNGDSQDLGRILDSTHCWRFTHNSNDKKRGITVISSFAKAFSATREEVNHYIDYTAARFFSESQQKPKPKMKQKEVSAAYREGTIEQDLIDEAKQESRPSPDKGNLDLDIYKIERFALQQMFIEDQVAAIFPEGQIKGSPFSRLLSEKRDDSDDPFVILGDETREVINELTQPVIALYNSDPTRKAASERFNEIIRLGANFRNIARYIDYEGSFTAPMSERPIWGTSRQGAAAPRIAEAYLSHVIHHALNYCQRTGDEPTPEELYTLAQNNRRKLIRLAMVNIDDFGEFTFTKNFRPITLDKLNMPLEDEPFLGIGRMEDGSLGLDIPITCQDVKGLGEAYQAATLGCPAGRVALKNINAHARGLNATNNFIDYIIEGMIDEAFERGIFNLKNYLDHRT